MKTFLRNAVYFCNAIVIVGALIIAIASLPRAASAQVKKAAAPEAKTSAHANAPDLKHQPTLYLVGYAHLDTQWRWEYPQVISEYLPDTMHKNFALFQKYPHYI
ncbi:MAG: hypothetical protein ACHQJX_08500, partial [Candidatus Acidiferrales bacterium]